MQKNITFASIGDLCIDQYTQLHTSFTGGSAFNTAIHAAKAGADVSLFTRLGTDANTKIFEEAFEKYSIDTSSIKKIKGQTSSINVTIDDTGQRSFSEWELGVLKNYRLSSSDETKLKNYDIAKITYYKSLQSLFEKFCQINFSKTIRVADFAGNSNDNENILTIEKYIEQCDIVIKSIESKDHQSFHFLNQLSLSHKNKIILVLMGEEGSMVFSDGKMHTQQTKKVHARDTNGAGDAYIAHFIVSYVRDGNIQLAMKKGTEAACKTISKNHRNTSATIHRTPPPPTISMVGIEKTRGSTKSFNNANCFEV
jgi:sugar/nucleoside kinase (ribokinase family)